MKCPKCGARNGETNKFCRECGYRLESLAKQQAPQDANLPDDELALGEELFDVMQLYSSGKLDEALEKIEKFLQAHPESASAHNIVALIFERKAEKASDKEVAKKLLEQAIGHYETIVELNPESGADREKLASLKLKLTGGARPARVLPASVKPLDLRAAYKSIPVPWRVAGAVFLLALMIFIVAFPGRREEPVRAAGKSEQAGSSVALSPRAAPAPTPQPLRIQMFPAPTQPATPAPSKPQPGTAESMPPGIQPLTLPPLGGVTIVPMDNDKSNAKKPASAQPKPPAEAKPKPAPTGPDGAGMLAQAIDQHDQGRTSDAIASAMEAQSLFQGEIDAGKNVTAAKRGLENTRKLLQIWREAEAPSGEQ